MVGIKDIYGDATGTVIRAQRHLARRTGDPDRTRPHPRTTTSTTWAMAAGDHVNGTTSNGGIDAADHPAQHGAQHSTTRPTPSASSRTSAPRPTAHRRQPASPAAATRSTAACNPGRSRQPTNIRVTNNRFSRIYFPQRWRLRPGRRLRAARRRQRLVTGNVWDEHRALPVSVRAARSRAGSAGAGRPELWRPRRRAAAGRRRDARDCAAWPRSDHDSSLSTVSA